jgi:hypothetical protein
MNVILAVEGNEAWECGAMPAPRPLSGKAREGKCARIRCEGWRGWLFRAPSFPCGKLF